MSYAGLAGGGNAGNYNWYGPAAGPPSMGDVNASRYHANMAYRQSPDYEREMHERGLQNAEQQRRQYDSETQRLDRQQKSGLLGGLLRGSNAGPYGQGMQSMGGFSVDGRGQMARF